MCTLQLDSSLLKLLREWDCTLTVLRSTPVSLDEYVAKEVLHGFESTILPLLAPTADRDNSGPECSNKSSGKAKTSFRFQDDDNQNPQNSNHSLSTQQLQLLRSTAQFLRKKHYFYKQNELKKWAVSYNVPPELFRAVSSMSCENSNGKEEKELEETTFAPSTHLIEQETYRLDISAQDLFNDNLCSSSFSKQTVEMKDTINVPAKKQKLEHAPTVLLQYICHPAGWKKENSFDELLILYYMSQLSCLATLSAENRETLKQHLQKDPLYGCYHRPFGLPLLSVEHSFSAYFTWKLREVLQQCISAVSLEHDGASFKVGTDCSENGWNAPSEAHQKKLEKDCALKMWQTLAEAHKAQKINVQKLYAAQIPNVHRFTPVPASTFLLEKPFFYKDSPSVSSSAGKNQGIRQQQKKKEKEVGHENIAKGEQEFHHATEHKEMQISRETLHQAIRTILESAQSIFSREETAALRLYQRLHAAGISSVESRTLDFSILQYWKNHCATGCIEIRPCYHVLLRPMHPFLGTNHIFMSYNELFSFCVHDAMVCSDSDEEDDEEKEKREPYQPFSSASTPSHALRVEESEEVVFLTHPNVKQFSQALALLSSSSSSSAKSPQQYPLTSTSKNEKAVHKKNFPAHEQEQFERDLFSWYEAVASNAVRVHKIWLQYTSESQQTDVAKTPLQQYLDDLDSLHALDCAFIHALLKHGAKKKSWRHHSTPPRNLDQCMIFFDDYFAINHPEYGALLHLFEKRGWVVRSDVLPLASDNDGNSNPEANTLFLALLQQAIKIFTQNQSSSSPPHDAIHSSYTFPLLFYGMDFSLETIHRVLSLFFSDTKNTTAWYDSGNGKSHETILSFVTNDARWTDCDEMNPLLQLLQNVHLRRQFITWWRDCVIVMPIFFTQSLVTQLRDDATCITRSPSYVKFLNELQIARCSVVHLNNDRTAHSVSLRGVWSEKNYFLHPSQQTHGSVDENQNTTPTTTVMGMSRVEKMARCKLLRDLTYAVPGYNTISGLKAVPPAHVPLEMEYTENLHLHSSSSLLMEMKNAIFAKNNMLEAVIIQSLEGSSACQETPLDNAAIISSILSVQLIHHEITASGTAKNVGNGSETRVAWIRALAQCPRFFRALRLECLQPHTSSTTATCYRCCENATEVSNRDFSAIALRVLEERARNCSGLIFYPGCKVRKEISSEMSGMVPEKMIVEHNHVITRIIWIRHAPLPGCHIANGNEWEDEEEEEEKNGAQEKKDSKENTYRLFPGATCCEKIVIGKDKVVYKHRVFWITRDAVQEYEMFLSNTFCPETTDDVNAKQVRSQMGFFFQLMDLHGTKSDHTSHAWTPSESMALNESWRAKSFFTASISSLESPVQPVLERLIFALGSGDDVGDPTISSSNLFDNETKRKNENNDNGNGDNINAPEQRVAEKRKHVLCWLHSGYSLKPPIFMVAQNNGFSAFLHQFGLAAMNVWNDKFNDASLSI
jgi:hypothetical protein